MINYKFLFYNTQDAFDRDLAAEIVSDDSIVFIGSSKKIWTHGIYFSGGGPVVPDPIDISNTPILYYAPASVDVDYTDITKYSTSITTLSSSSTWSKTLQSRFLYLAVPTNITLTGARTSNNEVLDLTTNIVPDRQSVLGYVLWRYEPVIAPSNLTLTFTFRVS